MAHMGQIRAGLAEALAAAVPEITPYDVVPDAVVVPAVLIVPASPFVTYQTRFGSGVAEWRLEATFVTGRIAEQAGQQRLDEWASPSGPIITALHEPDLRLGGIAETVTVTAGQSYGVVRFGSAEYLGFQLLIQVRA